VPDPHYGSDGVDWGAHAVVQVLLVRFVHRGSYDSRVLSRLGLVYIGLRQSMIVCPGWEGVWAR
jgi:hypothetical protein